MGIVTISSRVSLGLRILWALSTSNYGGLWPQNSGFVLPRVSYKVPGIIGLVGLDAVGMGTTSNTTFRP